MSVYLYLQCLDHEPHLQSVDEVGQHLYDLPAIRALIRDRDVLAQEWEDLVWPGGTTAEAQWRYNASRFFFDHPRCQVNIRSEYGDEYNREDK